MPIPSGEVIGGVMVATSMDFHSFTGQFPFLYHFGPIANRESVERLGCLLSSDLLRALSTQLRSDERRRGRHPVQATIFDAVLNDQDALKYGHVKHPDSMTETEFVALLDQFCFFWPGDQSGPIDMGRNFVRRYQRNGDRLFGLAVPTGNFLQANHSRRLSLSNCNSGAPRSNPNSVIYRGDATFIGWEHYRDTAATVKEVAVIGYARLPNFGFVDPNFGAEHLKD